MSRRRSLEALPTVVTSPKTSPAYQAHSYPTKIPPEAITPFIEACTRPGDLVLDPFCGSGMTGLAAQTVGRGAVLSDLSVGAVHLATNHCAQVDPNELLGRLAEFDRRWMRSAEARVYRTACPTCKEPALTRHLIWSDTHLCHDCGDEIVVWESADADNGAVGRTLRCDSCWATVQRAGSRAARQVPVQKTVACTGCRKLQTGPPSDVDYALLAKLARRKQRYWTPDAAIDTDREMYKRSALHLRGVETVRDFFMPRALHALGLLRSRIELVADESLRRALMFAFTNTAWHASRMRRYNARGGQRPLTGTLFIPQLVAEANVFEVFRHQVAQVASFYSSVKDRATVPVDVRQSSARDLRWLDDDSIDYVFTDPPFGSNIFYADCNIVWEAWLGNVTDPTDEMVVNRSRTPAEGGKTVDDYERLLAGAFSEARRVLKPGGRISVVFHNSDDEVWSALLAATESAGLRQSEVTILDKVQRSMKGYKGRSGQELVPFYDLVITFDTSRSRKAYLNGAGELAEDAVRRHLAALRPAQSRERCLDYLYSVAVAGVIEAGARPEGLSLRNFEALCTDRFDRTGQAFFIR